MATELVGKKNNNDYETQKLAYFRSKTYTELRLSHLELNRIFLEIIDSFFVETIKDLDSKIDTYF